MITERSKKQQKNKNKINLRIPFIRKCKKIATDLQFSISDVTSTSKSKWKKIKVKAIDRIRKRMKEDMQEKTKCCKIANGNWERKQYIKKCKSNTIKDMKIRLHSHVEQKMQLQKKLIRHMYVPFAVQKKPPKSI